MDSTTTIPSPQNSPYDDDEEGFQQRSASQFITLSTQDILQKYLDFASGDHILLIDSLLESVHTKMLSSISERKPSKSLQVTYPDILKRLHCTFCYLRRISHFLPQTYLMIHLNKFISIYLTLLNNYSETSLHYISEDSDLANFLHDLTNKIHNRTIQLTKSPKPEKLSKESLCIEWVLCDLIESSFHLEPALSFGNGIIETIIKLYITLEPTITAEKSPSERYIANKLCTSALHSVKQIIKSQEGLNGLKMPPLRAYLKFWIDNLGNQEPRQDQETENINVKKQYEELIMDIFANVNVGNHGWFDELSEILLNIIKELIQGKGPVHIEKEMEDQDRAKIIGILERLLGILKAPLQLTETIILLKHLLIIQEKKGEEGIWAKLREKCLGRIENMIALQQVLISELTDLDRSGLNDEEEDNSEEYICLLDEILELFKNIPEEESMNTILEDFIMYLVEVPASRFEVKVQQKILQVFDEVLLRDNLLDKALESANIVGTILRRLAHGVYFPLFARFIEAAYQKMTAKPDIAMPFFSKVKLFFLDFLHKAAPLEEEIGKFRAGFLTISHLIVKLLHSGSDQPDIFGSLSSDLNQIYNPNTFVFQPFLLTKKSASSQKEFSDSAIYEKILNCLELKEFQTTEIGLCLLTLTFCLLQDNKENLKNFTQNRYHLLFFKVLTGFNQSQLFSEKQAIMSINLLFNLLTNNEFFDLCQSPLKTQDSLITAEMVDSLTRDSEAKAIQYITLKNEDFLYVLLKVLFEWTGISQDTKLYYLEILDQILKNSLYNALSCLQGPIVNYLLICLRKERSEVIKRNLADLLRHMLVTNMGPLQLKSLIKGVRYDYQKLYPNSFKEHVSENVTKEFLEGMLDPESYYQTLQILFKDTIPKIIDNQKGNPESFIHFSGQSSGILIEDLVLKDLPKNSFLGSILSPLKGFSIYVEFRSENLNTMNKKELACKGDKKDLHSGLTVSTDMSSSVLSNYKIDEDYFPSEIVRRPTASIISSTQQQQEIKEMYHPRLFSLYSTKGPGNLDLYIDYHEGKRVIALEGWTTKKKMHLKQIFKAEIEEGKWYIMALNYSKSTVSLYLNGEEAKRDQEIDFSPVMSSLDTFNTLAVGVACDSNLNVQPPFDPKTSFQGQIRNFLLFPFEIPQGNLTRNLHTSRVSHRRQTMAKELRDSQPKKKVNKIDPEELFGASLFNLNVFVMISKLDVHKEIPWVPSFNINKKEKEDSSENNNDSRIRVSSQGVFYFETSKFEETLFAIGGLDAFIYCFELFANFTCFRDSKHSVEIFNEALKILQELTQHNYKEDSLAYLQNNGIYELIYLVQQFVIKQGGSMELVSGIMSFFDSLPENLMKYKGLHALFWKLNIWESCSYELQNQIFKKSMNLIQLDDSKKSYFRQNLNSLLYHMKKLHNSKATSLTDQDFLSTSLSDPFQSSDSKFRKTVLNEIMTNMCQDTDGDTARKELKTFIEYIASCSLDVHLYEALVTLIKLFNSSANKHLTGFLPLPKLQLIFDQVNLQSVLVFILIRCYSPDFQSRNPQNPPSERIVDLIAASTLNLIDYMIFSRVEEESEMPESMTQSFFGMRRSKQPSIHENRMHRIKSYSLIEPVSRQNSVPNYAPTMAVRLDSASPADEIEGIFLKLLNFTCGEEIDKESYQSLMRLIKTSETNDDDLLIKNKNLLAVVLNKAMVWNAEIQRLFLGELSKLLTFSKNLSVFFEAPNYHEFIHFCLDLENEGESHIKKEIARTCILYLMKSQEGMLKLIKACKSSGGEHKEKFFIKLVKDHLLEIFEKSMGVLEEPLSLEGEKTQIELMSKEFASNIIHLLTFINTWKLEDLIKYEEDIVRLSEVLFRLFGSLEIIWSILPDFRIQSKKNDALSIVKKMEAASLYKNGGVYFTFLHLLLNLYVHSKLPESKTLTLKALETLINPQNPSNPGSQNNLSLDKSIEDPMISKAMSQSQKIKIVLYETILLKKIDRENEILTGIMKYPNSLGYLEPLAINKKPTELPPLENLVFGYLLYILLQKILEMEEAEDEEKNEKKGLFKLVKHVIRQGGSGLRALSESFVGKEKQEMLIKMERNKKKDHETEQFFVKELDDMLEEIKGAEMEKKIAAKMKEPQEEQRRLLNEFLGEKDEMERFIKKNRGFIEKWLVPNLETRCAIVVNTTQEMSRWYYEINKGSQGTLRFEEILMEGKGLGIFMEMLEKAREMKERFDKEYNDWDMKERRNQLKIKKKWNFQRSKLTQDRGIWQTEDREQERIYYKIDKAEDFLRRRLRLKRDYQAQNKEYLSVAAYQEKYKARIEQEMELKSQQAAAQRALREAAKAEGRVSLRKTSSVKNNNVVVQDKENDEIQELEFNEIPKEEILLVDTRETVVDFQESMLVSRKKMIEKWKQPVEKIALKGAVYGDLEISQSKYISFSPGQIERSEDPPYCFGALKNSFIKGYKKKKQWKISNIKEVHARNYNLRPTAVEIFIKDDAKTYFFNLYTKELQQEFISLLKALNPKIFAIADRAKQFQELKIHNKWVEGELSNFEYLMILNTFAGRSFNDINQYPVFPWVIQDFTSDTLDLETEDEEQRKKIFRDLDTPIGAIDARKRADAREKFENWDDPSEPKFHYGSHYSNAGSVINFLIRLEPFTSLNIDLQSGKFDQADRLFASIRLAWHSCTHNRGDFRELTPEFYYMPEFLQNYNKMNFGKTQKNTDISEVELPPWANNKPEEFIMKHREALECDYVSQNLHKWIDLIFGSRQRGKKAAESFNVFRNISYEGGVDISQIEDKDMQSILLQQIFHLGQTPTQLFTEDHPAKNLLKIKTNKERLSYYIFNKNALKKETKQGLNINLIFKENPHPIIHISKDPEYIHVIYRNMDLYSIPYNPQSGLYNHFLIWEEAKKSSIITNLGSASLNEFDPSNQISTLLQPGRPTYHIVGGYPDNSFKIFKDGTIFDSFLLHKKVVTAIHSACVPRIRQTIIAAGSKDCRISLWNFSSDRPLPPEQKRTPYQILYGHHNEITALYIENILGILVSCDKDNVVMVFCVSTGKLQRSIYPQMEADDFIKMVRVDENGFIILLTTKSVILTYSINGKFLMKADEFSSKTGYEISSLSLIDRHKPYIVIAVSQNKRKGLIAIDYLTMREKKSLNTNMKYADRSHKKLAKEAVKELLKEKTPTMMIMGDGEKFMYLGYGNGALAVLGGNYENCFEENKVALTDFGFEI